MYVNATSKYIDISGIVQSYILLENILTYHEKSIYRAALVSTLLCSGVSGETADWLKRGLNSWVVFWNIRQHQSVFCISQSVSHNMMTIFALVIWFSNMWIKHFFELKLPQTLEIAHDSCLYRVSAEWAWWSDCVKRCVAGVACLDQLQQPIRNQDEKHKHSEDLGGRN